MQPLWSLHDPDPVPDLHRLSQVHGFGAAPNGFDADTHVPEARVFLHNKLFFRMPEH